METKYVLWCTEKHEKKGSRINGCWMIVGWKEQWMSSMKEMPWYKLIRKNKLEAAKQIYDGRASGLKRKGRLRNYGWIKIICTRYKCRHKNCQDPKHDFTMIVHYLWREAV